jgi:metallo-beta-lactamase family protein
LTSRISNRSQKVHASNNVGVKLHFLGANRQVTGSRYLLEAGGLRIMIDCGMFQERPFLSRNWEPCPFDARQIDFLLLTHAHLDHCGLLPKLVREGFHRPIIATPPTIDLTQIVLNDSGRIQEEDAAYKKKRHQREGRTGPHAEDPLYTLEDAQRVYPLFSPIAFNAPLPLNDRVSVTYHFAGHILGSALIEIAVRENGSVKTIVFSGDLGQWNRPLLHDPSVVQRADYVVMESTYGDRLHDERRTPADCLTDIINDTFERGGNIVMPTFALERPQEILFHLNHIIDAGRIPPLLVFLDSPMAVDVQSVFARYMNELDEQTQAMLRAGDNPLEFPGLKLSRSSRSSKAINNIKGTCMIMAGSGMCTGGRIKHHLVHNLGSPESTILFVGYQAQGTLGRQILDGMNPVRIFGAQHTVNAQITQITGLSAHGDRNDLLKWLGGFRAPPRQLFLTHGEENVALKLADDVRSTLNWNVTVPSYKEVVELE